MTLRTLAMLVLILSLLEVWCSLELSAQSDLPGVTIERPSWVVGDVPDTVWILMEAATAMTDEDDMKTMLVEAEGHARAATVDHEKDIGRRFALAAVLGLRADREGGRTKVRVASAFNDELNVVLKLDPDHPQARHMKGRLHAGVRRMGRVTRWLATNLLGGGTLKEATWEEAESNLSFAEERAPEVLDHHLQLARLYQDTHRLALAAVEIGHVLALEAVSPMELRTRDEALDLREDLQG